MRLLTSILAFLSVFSLASLASYTNPIRRPGGSDPFMVYSGGYYYLLTTSWTDVEIARATTVTGLKTAAKKVVYSTGTASRCCNVWSPEAHYLGGRWYIYYTAGDSSGTGNQRLHVLRGGASAWDAYTYVNQLTQEWSIDASVLRFANSGPYLMFSCFHGGAPQSICIQTLGSDFVSLTGSISVISQPTQAWETHGLAVNEAPTALYFGGKTMIVFSASYCWTQYYCLGTLTWDGHTAPTSPSAWTKSNGCQFSSANGNYGPGSNSFFTSPDGSTIFNAFHATSNSAGACDDSRYLMIQEVGTHSNGAPDFGSPAAFSHVFSDPQ